MKILWDQMVCENIPQLPCGKALYNYEGKEPGDLKFNKGDIIILRRKVDENWYHGELKGNHGFFPASYIQCIKPLPQPPPQGKALYDFEVKDKDQDKDCLTFSKDEVLTVIRRVDDNWAEGMLGDKIGIFPILYVELNETAKQLIEMDKTSTPASSGSDTTNPVAMSTGATATLNSTGAISAIHRRIDGKKNAKKRHSFTALSMTHKASQALNNRHSMEISAPVLISSSDPRAATRIGELPHLSSSAPAQESSSFASAAVVGAIGPRIGATGDQGTSPKVQLPLNIYLAMYAYKPQKNDELELRKGEMYRVIEKCQDGWFKGTSLRTGMSGVFPGNYVTPVSRAPFGIGQLRNSLPGTAPPVKGNPAAAQPGGAGLTNAIAVRPIAPVALTPAQPQLQSCTSPINSCLRLAGQQTVNQARSAMQMVHPTVPAQDRPTATVSPLRTQSPPSRVSATVRPHSMVSPQHVHQTAIAGGPGAPCARTIIPLTSAAAAITPPNVSAANLNGEVGGGLLSMSGINCIANASATVGKTEEKKTEKKEKKSGLLKLLSGASAKKKSRSPPSVSPTHEPQQQAAAAAEGPVHGAVGPEVLSVSSHGRAGSCPIESEMQGAMGMEPLHRKTGSLDLNFSISPPARQPCSSMAAVRPEPKLLPHERYRVVVPYPPQSEAEIELKEGDIVFVHKKREDGWFKGTLQRNGRTGLFPGSFVESF
nr:PREDICTED: SH3 domain-containing RING finger protein 3-like [Latimeria chalumnae]|eukprot:XP_014351657.1 PREDICTED: SH3 domain-containing RING finger protein 3-like [Latimeria chalumnae]